LKLDSGPAGPGTSISLGGVPFHVVWHRRHRRTPRSTGELDGHGWPHTQTRFSSPSGARFIAPVWLTIGLIVIFAGLAVVVVSVRKMPSLQPADSRIACSFDTAASFVLLTHSLRDTIMSSFAVEAGPRSQSEGSFFNVKLCIRRKRADVLRLVFLAHGA